MASLNYDARLSILTLCQYDPVNYEGPSWTPNLAMRPSGFLEPFTGSAAGDSAACAHSPSRESLYVSGKDCATITTVSDTASGSLEDITSTIYSWAPKDIESQSYLSGEPLLDAFLCILKLGKVKERIPTNKDPPMRELKDMFLQGRGHTLFKPEEIGGLSFATSSKGYIGLVPAQTRPGMYFIDYRGLPQMTLVGDRVCVILGCSVPLVLREVQPGEFVVIGQSYVQGLMDAEALLGPVPGPWRCQLHAIDGFWVPHYHNDETRILSLQDPRFGQLAADMEWEIVVKKDGEHRPKRPVSWRHKLTGSFEESEPRLTTAALEARGVKIETFKLV